MKPYLNVGSLLGHFWMITVSMCYFHDVGPWLLARCDDHSSILPVAWSSSAMHKVLSHAAHDISSIYDRPDTLTLDS